MIWKVENNELIKYEDGLIKRVGNAISVTNKLLAFSEPQLRDGVTWEEAKAQSDMLNQGAKEQFAAEAPEVQKRLKKIQTPLKFKDVVNIYRWLFREQITLEMLSKEVLDEFKETRQYRAVFRKINK